MRKTVLVVSILVTLLLFGSPLFAADGLAQTADDEYAEQLLERVQEFADEGLTFEMPTEGDPFAGHSEFLQKQAEAEAARQASFEAAAADPFHFTPLRTMLMLLPVLLTLVFWIVRSRLNKDALVVQTVEFYPPEGLDPAQTGFIYNGLIGRRSIASMAVYFADLGYIDIEYREGSFILHKAKEYEGSNPREAAFLHKLFAKSDSVSEKEFYRRFSGLKALLWESTNPFTIFTPLRGVWRMLMVAIGLSFIVPLYTRVIVASTFHGGTETNLSAYFALGSVGLTAFALWLGFFLGQRQMPTKRSWENRDYLRAALLFCSGFVSLNSILLVGYHPWRFLLFTAIYWGCFVLMASLLLSIRKRTEYGNRLLGQIRGFKNFLEVAEKDRLELLFADDPEYFYTILPYTYVLGVSNTWIDQYTRSHDRPHTRRVYCSSCSGR